MYKNSCGSGCKKWTKTTDVPEVECGPSDIINVSFKRQATIKYDTQTLNLRRHENYGNINSK